MRIPRFALWTILTAALTLGAFGCRGGAPGGSSPPDGGTPPVALTFWHTQTQANAAALEEMCRRFNGENGKGITVRPLYQGDYTQLYQKVVSSITARATPDIAVAYESMVAEYMKAGVVVPLDPYVTGPTGLSKDDLDDIFPAFLATNRYPQFGNKMLSFPFTKSVLVNYVDTDALKSAGIAAPPATWDDVTADAVKLTRPARGSSPAMRGIAIYPDASTIDGWIMAQGGTLFDASGAHFDTPAALSVFRAIAGLFKKGAAYETRNFDYQSDFGARRTAMVCVSSTPRLLFKPLIDNKFQWRLAMVPQKDPKNPVTVLYGANLCVFKSTPEKERAAWEFLQWLARKPQVAFWAIHSSYMPLRKSVARMPEMKQAWKQDPQGREAFDMVRFAKPEPNVRGWQEVRTALSRAMESVITGQQSPEAALKDLNVTANAIVQAKKV